MNLRISICRSVLILIPILVSAPPCWAQLIDQTRQLSVTDSRHHAFSLRVMKMRPEILRDMSTVVEYPRITHNRPVSTTIIDQIGKCKEAAPGRFGLHYSLPGALRPGI